MGARFCRLGEWLEQQVQRVLHRLSVTCEVPYHPVQFTLLLYNGGLTSSSQSMHYRASLAAQMAHTVLCINYISMYCSVWIESLNPSCFSGRPLSKATPQLHTWCYFRLNRLTKNYTHTSFCTTQEYVTQTKVILIWLFLQCFWLTLIMEWHTELLAHLSGCLQ